MWLPPSFRVCNGDYIVIIPRNWGAMSTEVQIPLNNDYVITITHPKGGGQSLIVYIWGKIRAPSPIVALELQTASKWVELPFMSYHTNWSEVVVMQTPNIDQNFVRQ